MSTKSLTEAFEVKPKIEINNENVKDYEVFGDKGLLESIRIKIVQNLIEENIPEDTLPEDYINNEIDSALVGYDLSNLERNHVFNLIQNEITGYGPITPLLEDNAITEIMVNAPNEIYVEIPMMNRKKGKTKSQSVSPFHTECCKGAYDTLPPALLTRIIPATVMPLSASSDKSLFLMGSACCAVSVLSSSFFILLSIVYQCYSLFRYFYTITFGRCRIGVLCQCPWFFQGIPIYGHGWIIGSGG